MRASIVFLPLLLVACAGGQPTANEQSALADVPGKPVGEPVTCLPMRDIESVKAVNNYVAFVHMRDNRVYRTDFAGGCRGLKRGDAFSLQTSVAQYCRGDIIHTFDAPSGASSGSCAFGSFTPYELPEKSNDD